MENSQSVENPGILEVEGTFEVIELSPSQSPPLLDESSVNRLPVFA